MADLPNAVVKRLISKHSGGMRISGGAIGMAAAAAEQYLQRLAQEAQAVAARNKRKTIMEADIEEAQGRLAGGSGGGG